MEPSLLDDPWNWGVEEVVHALCHKPETWSRVTAKPTLPDLTSLETTIREAGIDGQNLLTNVDNDVLREELKLTVFGQRGTTMNLVRRLRTQSKHYQVFRAEEAGLHAPFSFAAPFSSLQFGQTSHISRAEVRDSRYDQSLSPARLDMNGQDGLDREDIQPTAGTSSPSRLLQSRKRPASISSTSTMPPEPKRPRLSDVSRDEESVQATSTIGDADTAQPYPKKDDKSKKSKGYKGDQNDDNDERDKEKQEKKKRRVAPTVVSAEEVQSAEDQADAQRPETGNEDEPVSILDAMQTFEATPSPELVQQSSTPPLNDRNVSEPSNWCITPFTGHRGHYLSRQAMSVNAIFYGSAMLELLGHGIRHHTLVSPGNRSVSMAITSSGYNGVQRFVHKAMRDFLANSTHVAATRRDLRQHYDGDLVGSTPLLEARAADHEYAFADAAARGSDDEAGEYSYLKKWQNVDEDVILPVLGESGSENAYDSETWEQLQTELQRKKGRQGKTKGGVLSREEVLAIVNDCVEEFVEAWRQKTLPRREAKAWWMWRKARREGTKAKQIRLAESRLHNIDDVRLPKLIEEIGTQRWSNEAQVQHQCGVLEQSISEQQDQRWTITMLNRITQPTRPPPTQAKPKAPRAAKMAELETEDEEVLESESEQEDINDHVEVKRHIREFVLPDPVEKVEEPAEEDTDDTIQNHADDDVQAGAAADDDDSDEDIMTPVLARMRRRQGPRRRNVPPPSSDSVIALDSPLHTPVKKASATRQRFRTPEWANITDIVDLTRSSDRSVIEDLAGVAETDLDAPIVKIPDDDPFREPVKLKVERHPRRKPSSQDVVIDLDGDADSESGLASDGEALGRYDDLERIGSRPIEYYERRLDRKRLLIKLLQVTPEQVRMMFASRVLLIREGDFRNEIFGNLRARAKGETSMLGVDGKSFENISKVTSLYCAWYECKHRKTDPSTWPRELFQKMAEDGTAFRPFYDFLRHYFRDYNVPEPATPRSPPAKVRKRNRTQDRSKSSEDDDLASLDDTPHRKRKRPVQENLEARSARERDRERVQLQAARKRQLEQKFEKMGGGLNQDPAHIMVNVGKSDSEPAIYLHPRIGHKIKPHQLEGVQFLWREIVQNRTSRQGCLLAHDMGLGKTMQVITLLRTLAEAVSSAEPAVADQVPAHVRESRTLILCPAPLVENWSDEIQMWDPEHTIGKVRKLDVQLKDMAERLGEVSDWDREGGILIASYTIFRDIIHNKSKAKKEASRNKGKVKKEAPLSPADHEKVKRELLDRPAIIVADEAHYMKNEKSAIALAASQFATKSRIALTGSPLANSLEEYFTMIDWIAPGYLGTRLEFKAHFIEPIKEGLWLNSSHQEVRRSATRLRVLKEDLEPKVSRMHISVLKGELPSKTEFLIKVPLTPTQEKAYNSFVKGMLFKHDGRVSNPKLMAWLGTLGLLCNHPKSFRDKLEELQSKGSKESKKAESRRAADSSDELANQGTVDKEAPDDPQITESDVPSALIKEQLALLEGLDNSPNDVTLSRKMAILEQILDMALAAGEKTLIFSHHLPTLNYLEDLFGRSERRYQRLDGKTKMSERSKMTKDFNVGDDNIFLISTRAGGVGINLQGANRVVIMDFHHNPAHELQAIGRSYRIGQKKPVFVYRFQAGGTFEDVVYNKIVFKIQLANRVVDKRNMKRHARKDLSEYFYPVQEVPQEDLSEFVGKDPLVLDRILAGQDLDIRSITLTETLQEDEDIQFTAEEIKEADEMLKQSQLKRSDPAAWDRLNRERLAKTVQAQAQAQAHAQALVQARTQAALASSGAFLQPATAATTPRANVPPHPATSLMARNFATILDPVKRNAQQLAILDRQQGTASQARPAVQGAPSQVKPPAQQAPSQVKPPAQQAPSQLQPPAQQALGQTKPPAREGPGKKKLPEQTGASVGPDPLTEQASEPASLPASVSHNHPRLCRPWMSRFH